MAVPIEAMSVPCLVRLVNGWGSAPRLESGAESQPYPAVVTLGSGVGIPESVRSTLTPDVLIDLADRLHPVFAEPEPARRVDAVAGLLAATGVRPSLMLVDDQPGESWLVDEPGGALAAAAGLAFRDQLVHSDPSRVGVCAGRRCVDAYVDASPAGRRRFCSVTCQNRARIAAYRRRLSARNHLQDRVTT